MTAPVRLVVVRHGHTDANGGDEGVTLSGWTDTPLSPLGWRETGLVRDRLAGEGPFDGVYASPLSRARAGAELLAGAGLGPVRVDPDLREIGCGAVDGLPAARVRAEYPVLWAHNERQDDDDFRWPGGESYRELRARCLRAVARIAARHAGGRVVVVTHAGVVTQLVGAIEGTPAARWSMHRPGNASLTVLDWAPGSAAVVRFDDRDHLHASLAPRSTPPARAG